MSIPGSEEFTSVISLDPPASLWPDCIQYEEAEKWRLSWNSQWEQAKLFTAKIYTTYLESLLSQTCVLPYTFQLPLLLIPIG